MDSQALALTVHARRGRQTSRIERRGECEAGRVGDRPRGAGDGDAPVFHRLAQHLERLAAELGDLVEEEDAVMLKTDFARPRDRAAADETLRRDRVMRRSERTRGQEAAARREHASDGVNLRRDDRLAQRERWQDRREALGEHRLARAGRADQQHVVPAGGRDFERAFGVELAAYVGEIREPTSSSTGSSRRTR